MAALNQDLNRALDLFELTPANKICLLDSYKKTLSKCCVDPLRPPRLDEPTSTFSSYCLIWISDKLGLLRQFRNKVQAPGYLYGAILGAGVNRSHAISPQRIPAR